MIDYMLKLILHGVACNSLVAIHKALMARAKSRSTTLPTATADQKKAKEKSTKKTKTLVWQKRLEKGAMG